MLGLRTMVAVPVFVCVLLLESVLAGGTSSSVLRVEYHQTASGVQVLLTSPLTGETLRYNLSLG